MKITNLIGILLLVLLLVSCSDIIDSDPNYDRYIVKGKILEDQTHNVIMPLSLGNYWIYQVEEYDEEGNVTKEYLDTIKLINTNEYEGHTYFGYDAHCKNYVNTELGLWVKYFDECSELPPTWEVPYPINDGDSLFYEYFTAYPPIFKLQRIDKDNDGSYDSTFYKQVGQDTLVMAWSVKTNFENIDIDGIRYSSIKYRIKEIPILHNSKSLIPAFELMESWYQVNLGLLKENCYREAKDGSSYLYYKKVLIEYKLF